MMSMRVGSVYKQKWAESRAAFEVAFEIRPEPMELEYAPHPFVSEGDVGLPLSLGCKQASLDCGGPGAGQYRWRATAEMDVAIPSAGAPHITFWIRMAGGVACSTPTTESCFPYMCQAGNYDTRHEFGVLFDDKQGTGSSRNRVLVDWAGADGSLVCFAHVTETITAADTRVPWFEAPDDSQTGADGEMWDRYTVAVPAAYLGRTTRISVFVDHFQNWSSRSASGAFVDSVSITDSSGNCL